MSEINSVTDPYWIKYFIGLLIVAVNALMIYIFQGAKKDVIDLKADVKDLEIKVDKDHDLLIKINTEHEFNHPKNGN